MTLRIALSAAAAVAAPFLLVPTSASAAVPCTPSAVGRWCFDRTNPTNLPCIEGSFDPLSARLVECPSY